MNTDATIYTLLVSFFDWLMSVAPRLGFAIFLGWAIWKISTLWAGKFLKIDLRFDIIDNRLREHDVKIEKLMEGQHKLEVAVEKLDAKIDTLDVKIDTVAARLDARIDALEESLDLKFKRVDERFIHMEEKMDLRFKRLEDKFDMQHEVNKEILSILRGNPKNPPMTLVYPET